MCLLSKRCASFLLTASNITSFKSSYTTNHSVKKFESIPGPVSLPIIGTLYLYLPLIGRNQPDRYHKISLKNYQLYGPIVREEITPGNCIVWLYDPDDIEAVFKPEGGLPLRKSHTALEKYRLDRPHIYNTGGLLPTNGAEWSRLRKAFQKGISSPADALTFIEGSDCIIQEWITGRLEEIRGKADRDYLPELSRLFLEIIGYAAFDARFNCFYGDELHPNSRSSQLLNAALVSNHMILKTENGPQWWKRFETGPYRKLRKAQEYMESVAIDLVALKMSIYEEKPKNRSRTLIEKYLNNNNVDFKDIIGIACDFLLAGMDTTTYTTSFLLYHIATNPDVQERLFKEAYRLLPNIDDPVTPEIYRNAAYSKCCLKESLRLRPISIGIGRILSKNRVLSGYQVPRGTLVVSQNQVICRLETFFPEPDRYKPERWLRDDPEYQKPCSGYIMMPFGHGTRTCIAKRFAEENMITLLLKLVRKFKIEWKGGDIDVRTLLINKPDGPILLSLQER